MEQNKFKTGDIVVLVSGSPKMIIYKLDSKDIAGCMWFNAVTGLVETMNIPSICLNSTE